MLIDIMTDKGKMLAVLDNMNAYDEAKKLLIIACYGFNGERSECHRMTIKFAKRLQQLDVAVLRFDYLGLGISDGEFHQATLSSKVDNLIAVLHIVIEKMINVDNIALLGFSDGAVVALQALHHFKANAKLNGLLLWSPYVLAYEPKAGQENSNASNDNHASHDYKGSKENKGSINSMDNRMVAVKGDDEPAAGKDSQLSAAPIKRNRIKRDNIIVIPSYGLWRNLHYYDVPAAVLLDSFNREKVNHFTVYGGGDATVMPTIIKLKQWHEPDKLLEIPDADHTFNHSKWESEVLRESIQWITQVYKRLDG